MSSLKQTIYSILALLVMLLSFCAPTTTTASNITETPSTEVHAADTSPRLVLEAGGHCAVICELLFTADGNELVSVSDDKTIRVWSVSPDGKQAALRRSIRVPIEDGRAASSQQQRCRPRLQKDVNAG